VAVTSERDASYVHPEQTCNHIQRKRQDSGERQQEKDSVVLLVDDRRQLLLKQLDPLDQRRPNQLLQ